MNIDLTAVTNMTLLKRLTNLTCTVECFDGTEYTGTLLDVFDTGTIRVSSKPDASTPARWNWTQIPFESIDSITFDYS